MAPKDPLDVLRQIAGELPKGLSSYLASTPFGIPLHPGSGVPMPTMSFRSGRGGLAVPVGSGSAPIDFMSPYMVLSEYMGDAAAVLKQADPDSIVDGLIGACNGNDLMFALAALNRMAARPEHAPAAVSVMQAALQPDIRARFDNMSKQRRLFARQPVLTALRKVLAKFSPRQNLINPAVAAVLLVHAVGDQLSATKGGDDLETIGGMHGRLVLDMVANSDFYESDDPWAAIDRYVRLWRSHGSVCENLLGGKVSIDLLREATGLELEDFLALGFALFANVLAWRPGAPMLFNLQPGVQMDPAVISRFLQLFSATPAQMRAALATPRSGWDFLEFQAHPVLRLPEGLLILDEGLLWQRFTSGLFWLVHDHQRDHLGDVARRKWTQAWGDVVEVVAEEGLTQLAPRVLGGGAAVWDENNLRTAYGKRGGTADLVIDFGEALAVIEIVSAQLTINTRVDCTRGAFERDLEKLVIKKVRQIDGTARKLIANETKLTGVTVNHARTIIPIVVAAFGFPHLPPVHARLQERLRDEHLLQDGPFADLCILDLRDLELLEGAAERGDAPHHLLVEWQKSRLYRMPFRTWLWTQAGEKLGPRARPKRMDPAVTATMHELTDRLQLADDTGERWSPPVT